eukprot:9457889-Pyramimonas_sp.AAC.1
MPTCGPSGYDFFVVSSTLAHRAEAPQTMSETPVGTHCCVSLRLQNFWTAPVVWFEDPLQSLQPPQDQGCDPEATGARGGVGGRAG